ncbi:type IV secretion system protein VirD4 [Sphingomonas vulcanisoli]|uniref:Type IV secretion system protein VirD4 n=1 Tax=Sphingomonas vulcanisoli TaxID=1658060 RepID=A0ABX0TY52_9SPHN|nr:type IV secretory system conjugative DNA transfer family protein [Sphingomonas vulcanisoli]NIJ09350.1 type IV secretion system protein VirD4 [Sphingomonas vulcanisoli]
MIRIPGNHPPTKALAVAAILTVAVAAWIVLTVAIALVDLNQLSAHFQVRAVPSWLWYYRHDPHLQASLGRGALWGGLGVLFGALLLIWDRGRKPLHGAARFANEREIEGAGLRGTTGILLGRLRGRFVVAGQEAHVLLEAPTGSGKGVGIVIPNLLNWSGSVVTLDIKQENYQKTAGFRAEHGQHVFLFDPLDPDQLSARYNPLGYIDRRDPVHVVDELQKIAGMLFPLPERGEAFWAEAARTAFIGVGAYVAATAELPFTIGQIYRDLTTGDPKARLPALIDQRAQAGRPLSTPCVAALMDFTSASDNTFSGIKQTVTTKLGLWLNPHVDAATAASDFDLRRLRTERMSIYLGASPNNIERVAPLYNLIFQQLVDLNSDPSIGDFDPASQERVLVLLDEFARLGKAPMIVAAIAYIRSFGLNFLIVVQTRAQLRRLNGDDGAEEIVANCDAQVVYTPGTLRDAKEISERLGTHGQAARSKNRALGMFAKGGNSVSESEQSRALMLPQEVEAMPLSDVLIFKRGIPAIKVTKIIYYKMKEFTDRLQPPPRTIAPALNTPQAIGWVDRIPIEEGARPMGTCRLTEDQADGLEAIPVDALVIDSDIDPFAAIDRGEDPEEATRRWMMAAINASADEPERV